MADDLKEKIFDVIKNGDEEVVREILQKEEDININCKDKVFLSFLLFIFFLSRFFFVIVLDLFGGWVGR